MMERATRELDWMPVFVVQRAMRTIRSDGPEYDRTPESGAAPAPEDVWQRVGSAFAQPDGTWVISVNVFPPSRYIDPAG